MPPDALAADAVAVLALLRKFGRASYTYLKHNACADNSDRIVDALDELQKRELARRRTIVLRAQEHQTLWHPTNHSDKDPL